MYANKNYKTDGKVYYMPNKIFDENFSPHLIPMQRGILATSYATLKKPMTYEEVKAVYDKYYKDEYFVRVLENSTPPETRWVEGSNFVDVSFKVDERTGRIIMMGAMDNLVKGAAGQAVQNSEGNYKITENAARMMSKSSVLTRWKTMIENGYAPREFNDGFTDYVEVRSLTGNGSSQVGVADKNGELIVPIEYDNIYSGLGLYNTNGFYSDYIMVVKDRKAGYIRKDGQVTVEPDTYICPLFEPDYVGEQVVSRVWFTLARKVRCWPLLS